MVKISFKIPKKNCFFDYGSFYEIQWNFTFVDTFYLFSTVFRFHFRNSPLNIGIFSIWVRKKVLLSNNSNTRDHWEMVIFYLFMFCLSTVIHLIYQIKGNGVQFSQTIYAKFAKLHLTSDAHSWYAFEVFVNKGDESLLFYVLSIPNFPSRVNNPQDVDPRVVLGLYFLQT